MLGSILTKCLRDRWLGTTVGMAVVGAFLVLAMASYQQVDTTLYDQLPEAIRSVMGIPEGADPAALAYSVMYGMIASLTLAGLALSMGASSVAGEERDGTIGVLLGNPRSRRQLLASKAGAMVLLVTLGALLALGAGYLAPALLDVEIGQAHVLAVVVHLWLNALLWGAAAMAVGALTGNRALASALTGGVMVLAYFLVGLLPLLEAVADLARVVPWYWFDGHDPLTNGIAPGYAGLQVGLVVVLTAGAWWRVDGRDLRQASGTRGVVVDLLDRVRRDERAARILERLAGTARVRSIAVRATSEGQALVIVTAAAMFGMMGVMLGPMYVAIADSVADLQASLPETLLALAGGGDMSTPAGFYQLETFGLMAPIATILVAAAVGARALAGEERDRTMAVLLANPVPRRRVVLENVVAMVVHTTVVGVATFAGVTLGAVVAGLELSITGVAAACLHVTLLGVLFGTVALLLGAVTGRVRVATMGTVGLATAAYLADALLGITESLSGWARVSPFEWYLGGDPLLEGVQWSSVALFVGTTLVLVTLAVRAFERRDLRSG